MIQQPLKNSIDLKIKYLNGYFQFLIPKDRVANSSARIFALWITLPAFLLIAIAIIFLKNQTRPIINLAKHQKNLEEVKMLENIDHLVL